MFKQLENSLQAWNPSTQVSLTQQTQEEIELNRQRWEEIISWTMQKTLEWFVPPKLTSNWKSNENWWVVQNLIDYIG